MKFDASIKELAAEGGAHPGVLITLSNQGQEAKTRLEEVPDPEMIKAVNIFFDREDIPDAERQDIVTGTYGVPFVQDP